MTSDTYPRPAVGDRVHFRPEYVRTVRLFREAVPPYYIESIGTVVAVNAETFRIETATQVVRVPKRNITAAWPTYNWDDETNFEVMP